MRRQKDAQSELAEKVQKWVESIEGQKSIEEAIRNSKKIASKFCESRKINPKTLHEPVTF